jgi:hypothetical protein
MLLGVRDAPESLVEMSDAVAADLAVLSEALEQPGADLTLVVAQLGDSCALAVRSYLGFSINVTVGELPVSFSVLEESLDPAEIVSSVRFPLGAEVDQSAGSEIVLYAGAAGAFVDLAADLTYALGGGPDAVRLDQHLTPPDPALVASGLAAMSRHNQAIGILLERGLHPADAVIELHRLARLDSTSTDAAARRVIESATPPAPHSL